VILLVFNLVLVMDKFTTCIQDDVPRWMLHVNFFTVKHEYL
jgi:hypothetical protein